MRNAAATVAIVLGLLACSQEKKASEPANPDAAVVPMGMASAATLVASTAKVEPIARLHKPRELALAGDRLLVLDVTTDTGDADVVSIPIAPGGSAKTLATAQRDPRGIAFASGRVAMWISAASNDKKEPARILAIKGDADAAATAPKGAKASKPAVIAKTYEADETLTASDGTDVFTFGDVKDGNAEVLRLPATGKPSRVAVASGKARRALAVNATQVFWVQDGSLVWAPKAGGAVTPIVKIPGPKVQRLAADDASVYWTDSGTGDPAWSGRVYRVPIAGGKIDTISDAPSPFAIALDGDTIYWTSNASSGGRVLSIKKSGGATNVLAKDQHGPRTLAIDAKYVYFANDGDADVFRVEKPH